MSRFAPRRLVVAVDLSEPSRAAVEAAKTLARRWGSSLELVHVDIPAAFADPRLPLAASDHWWPWADFHAWREDRARRMIADFPRSRARVRRAEGWPPAVLAGLARSRSTGLLVMGCHGFEGLDRAMFGSMSETVVRRANVPVLAMRARRSPWRPRRILAPWNGRPYATRAARLAVDFARSLGGRATILHVAASPNEAAALEPALRRRLTAALGAGGWDLRVLSGEPRAVIFEEADPRRFDLLVLSAHRRPLSSDFVLGGTAERLLRHSRLPVLAVPSQGR